MQNESLSHVIQMQLLQIPRSTVPPSRESGDRKHQPYLRLHVAQQRSCRQWKQQDPETLSASLRIRRVAENSSRVQRGHMLPMHRQQQFLSYLSSLLSCPTPVL